MVFLSICTALYDYTPRTERELAIREGDLVYILEKSDDDDWWKAKKKASGDEEEEPMGLIPNNYVEQAQPIHQAKALYDYARQTDEEISFSEDASLLVFDTSDPDWILVGLKDEYGFAPANYIEIIQAVEEQSPLEAASPGLPARPVESRRSEEPSGRPDAADPSAILASITGRKATTTESRAVEEPEDAIEEDDEPVPILPQRPQSHQTGDSTDPQPNTHAPKHSDPSGILASPPLNRVNRSRGDSTPASPGGYHLYNVNEMVSVMGKQKKMPTTLGINLATGIILILPEKKRDGPQQEWSAEKLMHYSIEGKHVFMELVKPSKSIDFHAGAKDTAAEIVASLGELAGAARAEGLKEIIAAGKGGQKYGRMLYDFMAQGDDEVTVADGDEVIVINDTQSEEWWKVRRIRNGKEGVVPSSYVELISVSSPSIASPDVAHLNQGLSNVEQNRLEEERIARESMQASLKATRKQEQQELAKLREVGPGLKLPHRGSSLIAGHDDETATSQRSRRDNRTDSRVQASKSKPDTSKIRTWTDRSGSFKVDAQFIGLKDGKIHLHKVNGVKIAVPVAKMATPDLEYVERVTGRSLDEDKPLSDLVKRSSKGTNGKSSSPAPLTADPSQSRTEYDWFDFFLKCGVSPYQCERYSYNFNKDSMDESVLADISPGVLRNLGLKEGDVLRVMKYLDNKYGRTAAKPKGRNVSFGGEEVIGTDEGIEDGASSGSLFSGPGGALRNNTRKGRPAPAVQTKDSVDAETFRASKIQSEGAKSVATERPESPEARAPVPPLKDNVGFDDDAWDMKPQSVSRTQTAPSNIPSPREATSSQPPLSGGMADLSLLSQPLQPTVTHSTGAKPPDESQQTSTPDVGNLYQPQQHTSAQGTSPQFFSQLQPQPTGIPNLQPQSQTKQPQQALSQSQGFAAINNAPRQRPQAPQIQQQSSLMPPPPTRPLSAPQNASSPGNFGPPPIQPQLTGVVGAFGAPNQAYINQTSTNESNILNPSQLGHRPQVQQGLNGPQLYGTSYGQSYRQSFSQLSPQQTGFGQNQSMQPQMTGIPAQFGLNGPQNAGSFPATQFQPQNTNFQSSLGGFNNNGIPQQSSSINSVLPVPLQPQHTAINGYSGPITAQTNHTAPQVSFTQQSPPPPPPIPQMPSALPLQPQQTGPAPSVRFGVAHQAKPLVAQPTARKANLAQATPENPFGF